MVRMMVKPGLRRVEAVMVGVAGVLLLVGFVLSKVR
jgi:hypothetical protein